MRFIGLIHGDDGDTLLVEDEQRQRHRLPATVVVLADLSLSVVAQAPGMVSERAPFVFTVE